MWLIKGSFNSSTWTWYSVANKDLGGRNQRRNRLEAAQLNEYRLTTHCNVYSTFPFESSKELNVLRFRFLNLQGNALPTSYSHIPRSKPYSKSPLYSSSVAMTILLIRTSTRSLSSFSTSLDRIDLAASKLCYSGQQSASHSPHYRRKLRNGSWTYGHFHHRCLLSWNHFQSFRSRQTTFHPGRRPQWDRPFLGRIGRCQRACLEFRPPWGLCALFGLVVSGW